VYSLWRPNHERSVKSCCDGKRCAFIYKRQLYRLLSQHRLTDWTNRRFINKRGCSGKSMCVRAPIFHHLMLLWWAGSIELVNWITHLQPWCYWEAFWHCLMNRCTLLLFRKALWSKLKSEFRTISSLPCLDICN